MRDQVIKWLAALNVHTIKSRKKEYVLVNVVNLHELLRGLTMEEVVALATRNEDS